MGSVTDVDSVTDVCVESGIVKLSSNSGLVCYVPFCANTLRKGSCPSYALNSRVDKVL